MQLKAYVNTNVNFLIIKCVALPVFPPSALPPSIACVMEGG